MEQKAWNNVNNDSTENNIKKEHPVIPSYILKSFKP